MTEGRKLYISEDFWATKSWAPSKLTRHLFKLYELFDVCKGRLPQLEYLDVRLQIQGFDIDKSNFSMKYERETSVLTIISSDGEPLSWPSRGPHVNVHQ